MRGWGSRERGMDGGDEADACHTTRVHHRMFTNLDALRGHLLSLF